MNKKPKNQDLELLTELLLQGERGPGIWKSEREKYADINIIVHKNNNKRQSVPVVVPNKIETTPSLNSCEVNSKITKMDIDLDVDLSRNRHAA